MLVTKLPGRLSCALSLSQRQNMCELHAGSILAAVRPASFTLSTAVTQAWGLLCTVLWPVSSLRLTCTQAET